MFPDLNALVALVADIWSALGSPALALIVGTAIGIRALALDSKKILQSA